MQKLQVLVTGGAGYIGSHTCVELLNKDYEVIIVDNLSNSKIESINRIKIISGKEFVFYNADIQDKEAMMRIFSNHHIDSVIHFAGLKIVKESVEKPIKYYKNNINGTLNLCEVMNEFNVKKLVFSSSANVYGNIEIVPIKESFPLGPTNPYGRTKLMIEDILKDLYISDDSWNITMLRYFNPIGAHESGLIGEDPNGIPSNIMPYITQVAAGIREKLSVFGNDYETHDGTGIRDYIHVVDLAKGHLCALKKLDSNMGINTYNLGTGRGYSVLDLVKTFEEINCIKIPYEIVDRRTGDIAVSYADPSLAKAELGWKAEKDIVDMCRDSWNWQKKNPKGY